MARLACLVLLALPWLHSPLGAEETAAPAVYIIFDSSGSMWGQLPDGTHKVTAAREVLDEFVGQDFAGRELALRAYGHRRKADCSDSQLVVGFSTPEAAAPKIREFARGVNPKGKTPIGRSLRAALADMGDRPGEIILISDGIETCDDDPCALVKGWRDKNIAIRVHVVGLGLNEKEKEAMQCIADAAGTQFQDAQSAEQLAAGLETIRETAATPSPPPLSSWQVLTIKATNAAGERMRAFGTARREGFDPIEVSNNGHNKVPAGIWQVTVAVRTKNGTPYKPVTKTVEVETSGSTKVQFVVPEPPSVRAKFVERGEKHRGSTVTAYQGGKEVFRFRSKDRAYLDPGNYEFRSTPNADNELSVSASFADGDHKEILFELTHTVHAKIKMVAQGSGIWMRSNLELWQNGEKRYKVHGNNGVRALPGTYDVRLPLFLTPYLHEGLVLTEEAEQEFQIEVPVGHLTVYYRQADGTAIENKRIFLERVTTAGNKRDKLMRSDDRIPLTAGRYRLKGWSSLGDFDPVTFEMAVGEEKEITLQAKP